ncbi:hypothetical protein GGR28_001251 [Lewinella aquimaris]|uniref:Uncharacterized protein n=1 Tax=Neolewinella aquimaris TaxID=1835722 RepID=A0A840E9A9_9BACT|nr:hypothetical protein [Neolewinella aquimaris]MBB4078638.1 hypothetical protein [Neolewinella aquimaris]
MQAYQSKEFRRLPAQAKRAALKSSIAVQDPDSGFEEVFEHEGKQYRAVPIEEVNQAIEKVERPA